jgi:hypothetical protein
MLKIIGIMLLVLAGIMSALAVFVVAMSDETAKELDEISRLICKKVSARLQKESIGVMTMKQLIRVEMRKFDSKEEAMQEVAISIVTTLAKGIIGRNIPTIAYGKDECSLGSYNYVEDYIYVNSFYIDRAIRQKRSVSDLNILLDTICHELRHAWQNDNSIYNNDEYISSFIDYAAYRKQPCEKDARRYAHVKVYTMANKEREKILKEAYMHLCRYNRA